MATPKGIRTVKVGINDTDSVHVYSDKKKLWLQLRRDFPTEEDILTTSFKSAIVMSPMQAIAVAGELLKAASIAGVGDGKVLEEKKYPEIVVPLPENHGKQWTPEEDKQLVSRFHSKLSLENIAKKHKRGVGGIQSKLTKLGKLSPNGQPNGKLINTEPVAGGDATR